MRNFQFFDMSAHDISTNTHNFVLGTIFFHFVCAFFLCPSLSLAASFTLCCALFRATLCFAFISHNKIIAFPPISRFRSKTIFGSFYILCIYVCQWTNFCLCSSMVSIILLFRCGLCLCYLLLATNGGCTLRSNGMSKSPTAKWNWYIPRRSPQFLLSVCGILMRRCSIEPDRQIDRIHIDQEWMLFGMI